MFPVMSLNPIAETFVPLSVAPGLPKIPKPPQLNRGRPVKPMLPRVVWNKQQEQRSSVQFTVLNDSIPLDANENSSLFQELLICSQSKYAATKMVKRLVDDDYESSSESANTDDYESATATELIKYAGDQDQDKVQDDEEDHDDDDDISDITNE
jgi:hypothetical protein